MTHGCMLWGAALYNNGAFPHKQPRFGESYSMNGVPQRLQTWPPPSQEEMRYKGVLPYLEKSKRKEHGSRQSWEEKMAVVVQALEIFSR